MNNILFYIEFLFEKNYECISNYFIDQINNTSHQELNIAIILSLTKISDKLYKNISMLTSKKKSNENKLKIIDLSEEQTSSLIHDTKYEKIINHLISCNQALDTYIMNILKENRKLTLSTIFISDYIFSITSLFLYCIQKGYHISNIESTLFMYKFIIELNSEWNFTSNRKLICYSIECTLILLNEYILNKKLSNVDLNTYKNNVFPFIIDYSMIMREYAKDTIEDRKFILKNYVKEIGSYIQTIEENISNKPTIQSLLIIKTRFILILCILGKLKRDKLESLIDEFDIKQVMKRIENHYNLFNQDIQPIFHFEKEIKKYL